jgi:chaperonin GroES
MRALRDDVIIKLDAAPDASPGGIVLPKNAQQQPQTGVVVRLGPEQKGLAEGDRVWYSGYGGQAIELDGEELLVVKYENILAAE